MDLATLGTVLASLAVVGTAVNTWFQRRDNRRQAQGTLEQSKDALAWDIVKRHMENLQKEYDKLEKKHEQSEIDLRVQKREIDELRIQHHDCERDRRELEVQVGVLKVRVDELRGIGGTTS